MEKFVVKMIQINVTVGGEQGASIDNIISQESTVDTIFDDKEEKLGQEEDVLVTDEMANSNIVEGITIITGDGTITDETMNRSEFIADVEPSFLKHNKVHFFNLFFF